MATHHKPAELQTLEHAQIPEHRTIWERIHALRTRVVEGIRSLYGSGSQRRTRKTYRLSGGEDLEQRNLMSGIPVAAEIQLMDDLHTYEAELAEIGTALVTADPSVQTHVDSLKAESSDLLDIVFSAENPAPLPIDSATWKLSNDIPGSLAERVHPGAGHAFQATIDRQGKYIYTSAGSSPIQKVNAATGAVEPVQFLGHTSVVTAVAVSPDGSRVATGSHDRTVRIYDTTTGVMVGSFGVGNMSSSVEFSEDGKSVVGLGTDTNVVTYDLASGVAESIATQGQDNYVVRMTKDQSSLVYTMRSGVMVVDLKTKQQRAITLPGGGLRMGISGDSKTIFNLAPSGTLSAVDLATGGVLSTIPGLGNCIDLTVEGNIVTASFYGGFVRVFEHTNAGLVQQKEWNAGRPVMDVSVAHGNIVAVPAYDGTGNGRIVRFPGIEGTAAERQKIITESRVELQGIEDAVKVIATDVALALQSPFEKYKRNFLAENVAGVTSMRSSLQRLNTLGVLTIEESKECVRLEKLLAIHGKTDATSLSAAIESSLRLANDNEAWTLAGTSDRLHELTVREAKLSEATELLYAATRQAEELLLTGSGNTTEMQTLHATLTAGMESLLSKFDEWQSAADSFNTQKWNSLSSRTIATLFPRGNDPTEIATTTPLPIDSATWKLSNDIPGSLAERVHPGAGHAFQATIDRQGKYIYTSAGSSPIQKVNAATGAVEPVQFLGHTSIVTAVAVSPDGSRVATGSFDKTVRIYDTTTGALVGQFAVGNYAVSVDFSADGQKVAALGVDKDYGLYNLQSGALVTRPTLAETLTLAVSTELNTIVYTRTNSLLLADMTTGSERTVPLSLGEGRVGVSGDGKTAFVASSYGTLYAVDIASGAIVHSIPGLGYTMNIAVHGNVISTGSGDGKVRVFKYENTVLTQEKEYGTGRRAFDVSMAGSSVVALLTQDGTGEGRIARFEGVNSSAIETTAAETHKPHTSVVEMRGTTIIVDVEFAEAGDKLLLDEDSPLGTTNLTPDANGNAVASVIMNPTRPSGEYRLRHRRGSDGAESFITILWNKDTKTLSLKNAENQFLPSAHITDDGTLTAEELFARAQAQEQASLTLATDRSLSLLMTSGMQRAVATTGALDTPESKAFAALQRMVIAEKVDLISPVQFMARDFSSIFYRAFPEYKPENQQQTMQARGMTAQDFIDMSTRTYNEYKAHVSNFEVMMSTTVSQVMELVLKMRGGADIQSEIRPLADAINGANAGYAGVLGLRVPSFESLLSTCNTFLETQGEWLRTYFDQNTIVAARMDWAFLHAGTDYAGVGSATPSSSQREALGILDPSEARRVTRAAKLAYSAAVQRGETGEALALFRRGSDAAETVYKTAVRTDLQERIAMNPNAFAAHNNDLASLEGALAQERARAQKSVATKSMHGAAKSEGEIASIMADNYYGRSIDQYIGGDRSRINLGTVQKVMDSDGTSETKFLGIQPGNLGNITFTLTQDSMVNFGIETVNVSNVGNGTNDTYKPKFSVVLTGTDTAGHTYEWTNERTDRNAKSVSGRLKAGTYTLTVKNLSSESPVRKDLYSLHAPSYVSFGVDTKIVPYNSANIEGNISIEGSEKVMPVSLRVAEFIGSDRKVDYSKVSKLDPSKPVWVVVHGRANAESSSQIAELTRNLAALNVQVVTLDWELAANDNLIKKVSLEGSQWIEGVGTWAANQLKAAGFNGDNIRAIGHSWGSYVSYEIGAHIPGGIQTLIALDPAADSRVLGGGRYRGFSDPTFTFSNVAGSSYAFHSSIYGDGKKAKTAEYSFDIVAPEGYETGSRFLNPLERAREAYLNGGVASELRDEVINDAAKEHGFAVSLFSSLLTQQKEIPNNPISQLFALSKLQTDTGCFVRDGYEGTFEVDPMLYTNEIGAEAGKKSWQARAFGFYGKDTNGNDILYPRSL